MAALLWLVSDSLKLIQLLRWLQLDSSSEAGPTSGLWGEVTTRVRRMLRDRERKGQEYKTRLQDFLSALQVSPNGVMMLDGESHIEWCNQTSATHFGLDVQRDLDQAIGNLVRDPGFTAYLSRGEYQKSLTMTGRESTPSRPVTLSVQIHPYGRGRKLLLSRDVTTLEQAE
ncbi:MAG: two-component system OmpR family phosphate regulon sensor histidine kinase PhoR, partial [Comamonadaceae bacterium]